MKYSINMLGHIKRGLNGHKMKHSTRLHLIPFLVVVLCMRIADCLDIMMSQSGPDAQFDKAHVGSLEIGDGKNNCKSTASIILGYRNSSLLAVHIYGSLQF